MFGKKNDLREITTGRRKVVEREWSKGRLKVRVDFRVTKGE